MIYLTTFYRIFFFNFKAILLCMLSTDLHFQTRNVQIIFIKLKKGSKKLPFLNGSRVQL